MASEPIRGGQTDVPEFYRTCAMFYDRDYAEILREGIDFYVALGLEFGGPALEMGCGTGRVLLPTARAGITICGMELSADMIDVLRRSLAVEPEEVRGRTRLVHGDIRCDYADSSFPLITAPFRVVQHLLEPEDQHAWLRNVRRQLAPKGCLCFDVFQFDPQYVTGPGAANVTINRMEPETGYRVRRFDTVISYPERQILEIRLAWVKENAAGERISSTKASCSLRWYTAGELRDLLATEGYEITDYWGDFDRSPFGPKSPHQIIRARLRAE